MDVTIRPEVQAILEQISGGSGISVTMLNTTIVPSSAAEGEFVVLDVSAAEARELVKWASIAMDECHGWLKSAIGHDATATAFKAAAGQGWVDRTPWDGSGYGLALQLKGRLPEGKIATLAEMEEIGYSFRLIYRGGSSVSKRVRDLEERLERLLGPLNLYIVAVAHRMAAVPNGGDRVPVDEAELYGELKALLSPSAPKNSGRATAAGIAAAIGRSEERRLAGDQIGEVRVDQLEQTGRITREEADRRRSLIAESKGQSRLERIYDPADVDEIERLAAGKAGQPIPVEERARRQDLADADAENTGMPRIVVPDHFTD